MIKIDSLIKILKRNNSDFFTGVPDSVLKELSQYLQSKKNSKHVLATNEGSAISIGIGYYLSQKKLPCVYMQNSGLSNALNPLISIAHPKVYSIPLILIIGWRGSPKIKDEPQHNVKGKITEKILKLLNIKYTIIRSNNDLKKFDKLIKLAKKNKLYVGNAPDTFLGGGIQKSRELLDKKVIGKVKFGNAIFAYPGVQSYHPNPEPWFGKKGGGPVIDMGPYYLTALVNLLGPAKEVFSQSEKGKSKRIIGIGPKKGKKFKVECPTTYFSTIKFFNGTIIRLTLSFDVISHLRNHIELYGNEGSMIVPDPNMFGGSVLISKKLGSSWKNFKTNKMTLGKINIRSQSSRANESPTNANYRGVGLSEMISSIQKKKLHKCSGNLSLHVLNIIDAIHNSAKKGKKIKINQLCERPSIFSKKEIKSIIK